ncbi:MAG: DUF1015 domain-containing protein [Clostridia bacterium]|nr:DUF1015 domain-containing protein [Clostridia bacterium]
MNNFDKVGIAPARFLFPTSYIETWATIACDQHTSNPAYWKEVERVIGDDPSSLDLMMPEAWLNDESRKAHQEQIPALMKQYMEDDTLRDIGEGFMFIHREMSNGYFRRGLLCLLDLDKYEYAPGNKALCRATEGVVEDRLPTRIEIRKNAPLEMPHVMVLVNDKSNLLMGQLDLLVRNRQPYYNTDLMMGGGKIRGWFIKNEREWGIIEKSLITLLGASKFAQKGMLYAVGDGNHSLAAAKKCGDRYAMVELVNVHDPAVEFFPIHRILDADGNVVDYIHGEEEAKRIAEERGLTAQIMPDYPKEKLFKDVIKNGILPKKTFSIGESIDKRYYLECRALHE